MRVLGLFWLGGILEGRGFGAWEEKRAYNLAFQLSVVSRFVLLMGDERAVGMVVDGRGRRCCVKIRGGRIW